MRTRTHGAPLRTPGVDITTISAAISAIARGMWRTGRLGQATGCAGTLLVGGVKHAALMGQDHHIFLTTNNLELPRLGNDPLEDQLITSFSRKTSHFYGGIPVFAREKPLMQISLAHFAECRWLLHQSSCHIISIGSWILSSSESYVLQCFAGCQWPSMTTLSISLSLSLDHMDHLSPLQI